MPECADRRNKYHHRRHNNPSHHAFLCTHYHEDHPKRRLSVSSQRRVSWRIGLLQVHNLFTWISKRWRLFPHAQEKMPLPHLFQSQWVLSVWHLLELAARSKICFLKNALNPFSFPFLPKTVHSPLHKVPKYGNLPRIRTNCRTQLIRGQALDTRRLQRVTNIYEISCNYSILTKRLECNVWSENALLFLSISHQTDVFFLLWTEKN